MIFSLSSFFPVKTTAASIRFSSKKITLKVNQKKTLRLKGAKKKVTFRIISGKKNIRIKKRYKTLIQIQGVKKGIAKISAKYKKKTYICKITIKKTTGNPSDKNNNSSDTPGSDSNKNPSDNNQNPSDNEQNPSDNNPKSSEDFSSLADSIYTKEDLVFLDDFDGADLNTNNWTMESHEPGWKNNELEEYVGKSKNETTKNLTVADGQMTIHPICTKNADGSPHYTSACINSRNKVDFTYGRFEIRAKLPIGTGFWPAFWLLPTDEEKYGEHPMSGEIDIMENVGWEPDTNHASVHYGNPLTSSSKSYTLENGLFSDGFHIFSMEWDPGEMRFYVDGKLYHTVRRWYSGETYETRKPYPAPFDTDFYMIINLAIGGNWAKEPDSNTIFDERTNLTVDYVRIFRKSDDYYNRNVSEPLTVYGENLLKNADFSNGTESWEFNVDASTGSCATIEVLNNAICYDITNTGENDWDVQLIQSNLTLEQKKSYNVSFSASSSKERDIIAALWRRGSDPGGNGKNITYGIQRFHLSEEEQDFSFTMDMENASDSAVKLLISMGNMGDETPPSKITLKNLKVCEMSDNDFTRKIFQKRLPD